MFFGQALSEDEEGFVQIDMFLRVLIGVIVVDMEDKNECGRFLIGVDGKGMKGEMINVVLLDCGC